MVRLDGCDVYLGGQGWSEPDWRGVFYPPGLKPAERLAYYASAFEFVEIDSSFYAPPNELTVRNWAARTPPGFRFTAKVPQSITHDPDPETRLPRRPLASEGWKERLYEFAATLRLLDDKLLALLVQLPPQWHWQPARLTVLERFVAALPREVQWAIEFRHPGWLNDEVLSLLRAHDVALTLQDLYYMPRQVAVTTPRLAYIRLQGERRAITDMDHVQIHRDRARDWWAEAVQQLAKSGVERVVVAVNNHYEGFSPGTLAALQQRLGFPVSAPPAARQGRLPLG
jgi:uncharacterized protein YecE (DUF72 family)